MSMDYPEGQYWGLYYAQSVSLTRFLVEQGTPTQFVQFVQQAATERPRERTAADLQHQWIRRPSDPLDGLREEPIRRNDSHCDPAGPGREFDVTITAAAASTTAPRTTRYTEKYHNRPDRTIFTSQMMAP